MIKIVDEALIESLKKGLSGLIPPENIVLGEVDMQKSKYLALENADFTVAEEGIGGSAQEKREEVAESIEPDGSKSEFDLAGNPLRPIINVEASDGSLMSEPDDYKLDYQKNKIHFRVPPPKGQPVLVRYYLGRSIAEVRTLKLALTYYLTIWANDPLERDSITIEAIKTIYSHLKDLERKGIEEIKLIKGQLLNLSEDQTTKARRIEYLVKADIRIETPLTPIERIEIGEMK
jgi:hypothetical protein